MPLHRVLILLALASQAGCVIDRGALAGSDAGVDAASVLDARLLDDAATDAPRPVDAPPPEDAFSVDDVFSLDDAFVGLDAPAVDAFSPLDAFAAPDAFRLPDAFVPPDAFTVPDAFVPPDAFSAPDAFVPPDAFRVPDAFVRPDAYAISADLVAYYPFASSPLTDATGNGHTLTNSGVRFDGAVGHFSTGDALTTPDAADLDEIVAIAAWVRPASAPASGGRMAVVDREGSFSLFVYDRSRASCSLYGGRIYGADGSAPAGAWTHLACVLDAGGTARLYVNGTEAASVASPAPPDGTSRIQIGQNCCDGSNELDGELTDVRFYRRAITPVEVSVLSGVTPP